MIQIGLIITSTELVNVKRSPMLNTIKEEVLALSETELEEYVLLNKNPEDSMISYYMAHLSKFFEKEQDKINIQLIIHNEFNGESEHYNLLSQTYKYSRENKLSPSEKEALFNKASEVYSHDITRFVDIVGHCGNKFELDFEKEKQKFFKNIREKLVITIQNLWIRGKLRFHYQLLFNYDENTLETSVQFERVGAQKKLNKLQEKNYWIAREWIETNDIILFGNDARMKINFCDLSAKKIQEIQFFILSILNKSYVLTGGSSESAEMPVKITTLQELIENERLIQFKKANRQDITDHPDISFSFANRYLCWLQKNINYDNMEYFNFFSGYYYETRKKDTYFNKMGLNYSVNYPGHEPFMSTDFYFFVNGNDENSTVDFYVWNKKVKSCIIKDSANFPQECRDYIKKDIEYFFNHWLAKIIIKYAVIRPVIIKPLKKKYGESLRGLTSKFDIPFTLEMLNQKRFPLMLKCKGSNFCLSSRDKIWETEEYADELLATVGKKELNTTLSKSIQGVSDSKPVSKRNRL